MAMDINCARKLMELNTTITNIDSYIEKIDKKIRKAISKKKIQIETGYLPQNVAFKLSEHYHKMGFTVYRFDSFLGVFFGFHYYQYLCIDWAD